MQSFVLLGEGRVVRLEFVADEPGHIVLPCLHCDSKHPLEETLNSALREGEIIQPSLRDECA